MRASRFSLSHQSAQNTVLGKRSPTPSDASLLEIEHLMIYVLQTFAAVDGFFS
ncbi:MAG: hypothetical protein AAF703_00150 [Cyanobacteria bacterium P01_D01_bin.105]